MNNPENFRDKIRDASIGFGVDTLMFIGGLGRIGAAMLATVETARMLNGEVPSTEEYVALGALATVGAAGKVTELVANNGKSVYPI